MLNEKIKSLITANHIFSPKLTWMNNSKRRTRFTGNWLKQDKVTFNWRNALSLFIVYELDKGSEDINIDCTPKYCLFGAVKSFKNGDSDKYSYPGYDVGFDSRSRFLNLGFDWD